VSATEPAAMPAPSAIANSTSGGNRDEVRADDPVRGRDRASSGGVDRTRKNAT
jgi:hypothetical protein